MTTAKPNGKFNRRIESLLKYWNEGKPGKGDRPTKKAGKHALAMWLKLTKREKRQKNGS